MQSFCAIFCLQFKDAGHSFQINFINILYTKNSLSLNLDVIVSIIIDLFLQNSLHTFDCKTVDNSLQFQAVLCICIM